MESNRDNQYFSIPKFRLWYRRYFNMLYNLSVSRFAWTGLPEEVPPQFLEDVLFWNGQALFFEDDVLKKCAVMKVNLGGMIDIYGKPNRRYSYANNYFRELSKRDSVLINDNATMYPVADYVQMFADSLANMRLTRDINIYAQRTPITFAGNSSQRLSTRNLFKQYNDFVPFIEVKDGITDLDKLKVLRTDAPIVFDKLMIAMKQEISDFCNLIGIDSIDGNKRERLVADEVRQNADMTEINRKSYLSLRERACDQINRLYGLNVSVEYVGTTLDINSISDGSGVGFDTIEEVDEP